SEQSRTIYFGFSNVSLGCRQRPLSGRATEHPREQTMLEIRRLRLLRELSIRGTIAEVSDALSYSPSSVSQQLSLLEKETGVKLLRKVGRRLQLTPQAEVLVAHTDELLDSMERAEA